MASLNLSQYLSQYKDNLSYQSMLLGGACAVVSLLLIAANETTLPLIEEHLINDKLMMLEQVLPASEYDNDPLSTAQALESQVVYDAEILSASMADELQANAIQLTLPGWGGPLQMIMAVDTQGVVKGVRVISHKETPGLADKIEREKSDWITSFEGKSLANTPAKDWAVKKDGGQFDQFTGATITPRAVVKGVYQGLLLHQAAQSDDSASTTHSAAN